MGLQVIKGAFSGGGELGIIGLDSWVGLVALSEDFSGAGGGGEGIYFSGNLFKFALGVDRFFVVDFDVFAGAAEGVAGVVIAGTGGGMHIGGPAAERL